jgi:hypothetical protein
MPDPLLFTAYILPIIRKNWILHNVLHTDDGAVVEAAVLLKDLGQCYGEVKHL